tara:strand:+ start:84 stop:200 length:117 start_codon:yes stop_codon:yes gene_type:complete
VVLEETLKVLVVQDQVQTDLSETEEEDLTFLVVWTMEI